MTVTVGYFQFTPEQKRFRDLRSAYPTLVRYWNFETRDCDLAGLDNAVRVFSQGEQNMAQFFRCVWLGHGEHYFPLVEAVKMLSDEDLAVTTSPVGSETHSSRNGFH